MATRKLGETQISVHRALVEHGGWEEGCGWLWDTPSGTRRIMDSLVRRGLATSSYDKDKGRWSYAAVPGAKAS